MGAVRHDAQHRAADAFDGVQGLQQPFFGGDPGAHDENHVVDDRHEVDDVVRETQRARVDHDGCAKARTVRSNLFGGGDQPGSLAGRGAGCGDRQVDAPMLCQAASWLLSQVR